MKEVWHNQDSSKCGSPGQTEQWKNKELSKRGEQEPDSHSDWASEILCGDGTMFQKENHYCSPPPSWTQIHKRLNSLASFLTIMFGDREAPSQQWSLLNVKLCHSAQDLRQRQRVTFQHDNNLSTQPRPTGQLKAYWTSLEKPEKHWVQHMIFHVFKYISKIMNLLCHYVELDVD